MSEAGLLGTVERYFAEIMPIPRLQQRIDCFIFTRSFEPAMQRVSTRVLCNPVNPVLYHEARLFLIIICQAASQAGTVSWSVYCSGQDIKMLRAQRLVIVISAQESMEEARHGEAWSCRCAASWRC